MNKKGFTLIELLAVIIILGILMIIAIPSVTSYINDSRKSAYIDTAREIIAGTRNIVNEGKLGMYDTNTTYYIPVSYIKTENASKSPYGEFVEDAAYVAITYNGTGYTYYWISVDDTGQGVNKIELFDNLDTDDIESDIEVEDIKEIVENTGIGNRNLVQVLKSDGTWKDPHMASVHVSENGGAGAKLSQLESTCPQCVYRLSSTHKKMGDTLNHTEYITNPSALSEKVFLGHVLDSQNKITQSYSCFIYRVASEEKIYCVRGGVSNTSVADDNMNLVRPLFDNCQTTTTVGGRMSGCSGSGIVVHVYKITSGSCSSVNGQFVCSPTGVMTDTKYQSTQCTVEVDSDSYC